MAISITMFGGPGLPAAALLTFPNPWHGQATALGNGLFTVAAVDVPAAFLMGMQPAPGTPWPLAHNMNVPPALLAQTNSIYSTSTQLITLPDGTTTPVVAGSIAAIPTAWVQWAKVLGFTPLTA